MAKIEKASEDVEKLFDEVRDNTGIQNWVEFKVLCNNKQKEVCKVVKSSELVELLTEGLNFAVVINEEIFDGLPENMKRMAVDEAIAGVQVSESDALSIAPFDFCTHSGVLAKYGDGEIIKLHECIKSLYDVKKQKEDEAKAILKAKKNKKKD